MATVYVVKLKMDQVWKNLIMVWILRDLSAKGNVNSLKNILRLQLLKEANRTEKGKYIEKIQNNTTKDRVISIWLSQQTIKIMVS